MMEEVPLEIDVATAADRVRQGSAPAFRLIDCREADEWQICHIDGAELVPLSQFQELAPRKLGDPEAEILVYCHHGVRSMHATQWLRQQGYSRAQSMRGGIDQWSVQVDAEVVRY